jgi:hypothetical protein
LGGNNFTYEWSEDAAVSGTRSLQISRTDLAPNEFGFWAQTVAVGNLAGTRLTLRTSVKLEGVTGEGVAIAIRGDDTPVPQGMAETFASTQRRISATGTLDWTELKVSLDEFPADIQSVTIYLMFVGATGTANFDDVSLSSGAATHTYSLEDGDIADAFSGAWWYGGLEAQHYTFERSSDEATSPPQSLRISKEVSVDSTFGFWAQTIRADSLVGHDLTLTVWLLKDGLVGEGAAVALRGDDTVLPSGYAEVFATTQGQELIVGKGNWQAYSVVLPALPSEIQSLTVYLIHLPNTTGTVYFDDITLEPTS